MSILSILSTLSSKYFKPLFALPLKSSNYISKCYLSIVSKKLFFPSVDGEIYGILLTSSNHKFKSVSNMKSTPNNSKTLTSFHNVFLAILPIWAKAYLNLGRR